MVKGPISNYLTPPEEKKVTTSSRWQAHLLRLPQAVTTTSLHAWQSVNKEHSRLGPRFMAGAEVSLMAVQLKIRPLEQPRVQNRVFMRQKYKL
ncbi:hypothetical protein Pmani_030815 [Petrolisthes manimaculis]|uniref:Uncharacterized protein n=1 Tax=Petrolisthes manimaculis TaxID=1843537 RepID=A0AAE1NWM4_9EUCA|nr:hypothetical protein Pmani_030815 [Petrolisthes manimaculis]